MEPIQGVAMRATIITWLLNASVAAFAVGGLQIPLHGLRGQEVCALIICVWFLALALFLSRKKEH